MQEPSSSTSLISLLWKIQNSCHFKNNPEKLVTWDQGIYLFIEYAQSSNKAYTYNKNLKRYKKNVKRETIELENISDENVVQIQVWYNWLTSFVTH